LNAAAFSLSSDGQLSATTTRPPGAQTRTISFNTASGSRKWWNEKRVATIVGLCAQGYADRIVLSHDAACYMDFFSGEAAQAALAQAAPNWHYLHIHRDVLPALREGGVSEEQIRAMLVDNPKRYFS